MVWDLRGALLKKGEVETARLDAFDFKLRVRTLRLLAGKLEADEAATVALAAQGGDADVLQILTERHGADVTALYEQCRKAARKTLIAELGNPAPHRLL